MIETRYVIGVIAAMGLVTFALRALPFVGAQWLNKHPLVQRLGESAALLFTAGAAEVIAGSIAKAYTSNGATLSVLLYLRAFEDGDFASAWGIGAVLLVLVLLIDLAARLAKTKLKQKQ